MDIATLRHYLDDANAAHEFLKSLGVIDLPRAHAALDRAMASAGVTLDLLAGICDQLGQTLARCPDPEMALNNLDRFVAQGRNPLSIGTLFEPRRHSPADIDPDFFHKPALFRPADRRPRGPRPVAADGRLAGGPTNARRGPGGGNFGIGT